VSPFWEKSTGEASFERRTISNIQDANTKGKQPARSEGRKVIFQASGGTFYGGSNGNRRAGVRAHAFLN